MPTMTAAEAHAVFYALIDQVAATHEPVLITGRRNNSVLLSEDDWRAINETMYLLSIPGISESIREGMATSVGDCIGNIALLYE